MSELNKHLTRSDRNEIEASLVKGISKSKIAINIGKDKSTVCKEVKNRKYIQLSGSQLKHGGVRDCIHKEICENCINSFCKKACDKYIMQPCKRRDKMVGVCNGCETIKACRKTKYKYDAKKAHEEYESTLIETRSGVDLSYNDAKKLAEQIKPLLENGQSISSILLSHPKISYCEKTIYNYIELDVLKEFGVDVFLLRQKVKRKQRAISMNKAKYNPKIANKHTKGRTYSDLNNYLIENPTARIVEMDTVYNDVSNGPFIQTFFFRDLKIMYAILHENKTAESMINGIYLLKEKLGYVLFKELVDVLLTDRGTEFFISDLVEDLGIKLFYCDPMASYQKSSLENIHGPLRYILPKKSDLRKIGLTSQEAMNLVTSHVNSYTVKSVNGKSRFDYLKTLEINKSYDIINCLELTHIEADMVIMKPKLLNAFKEKK